MNFSKYWNINNIIFPQYKKILKLKTSNEIICKIHR